MDVLFRHFDQIIIATVGINVVAFLIFALQKKRNTRSAPEGAVLYSETGVSGFSLKSFISKSGGARRCLKVAVYRDEVTIGLIPPFSWVYRGPAESLFDFNQRFMKRDVVEIKDSPRFL